MNWLRKIFSRNQDTSASADDEVEDGFLTRDEGMEFASRESLRDLIVTACQISYVRYADDFDDFCRVQITFDSQDRGTYTIQLLPVNERHPEEMVDDARIASVARRDRRLNAVRLYRHLHQCSLAEAIKAVAILERDGDNRDAESK